MTDTKLNLLADIETVKGIGPKTAAKLKQHGLSTVRDLVYYFPRAYEDYAATTHISNLKPGKIIIKGKIRNLRTRYTRRRNFNITEGEIYDDTGSIRVVWYNQPYRTKAFLPNQTYYFSGQYDFKYNRYQLTSPTATNTKDIALTDQASGFQPIYPALGSCNSAWFKKIFTKLRLSLSKLPELIPLTPQSPDFFHPQIRAESIFNMHFPSQPKEVQKAKKYLAYEELFELMLAAQLNRISTHQLSALLLKFDSTQARKLVKSLPFTLTNAQKLATWDILQDLGQTTPMNRLLQGDVGSGKTVVAALSAYQATVNGGQVAVLAPTAILATQHAESFRTLLEPFGVKIALLIGATKQKTNLKQRIKNGEIDIVIGTHALLTDDTQFHNLAFCIIDEQHRFGVNQRQKLLTKTNHRAPHLLAMTATPIPRSLQLTVFGDLAVSTINQLPAERHPIETKILSEVNQSSQLYPKIKQALANYQQVYWICKKIETDARQETSDVQKQAKKLSKLFPTAKIAYLHGRMKPDQKDQIMSDFSNHSIDILVATTVIEVGINVPNATHIVIMDAEQYGLAQLHQLRGRVGRGKLASFCYFVTTGDEAPSRRLRELERSNNGFHLAEVDLKLRGPGEIYGQLQHGALSLKIANFTDTNLISQVKKQVDEFVEAPDLMLKYPELAHQIQKYQQLTILN